MPYNLFGEKSFSNIRSKSPLEQPDTHPPFPLCQQLAWCAVRHCIEAKTLDLAYLIETTGHDGSGKLL